MDLFFFGGGLKFCSPSHSSRFGRHPCYCSAACCNGTKTTIPAPDRARRRGGSFFPPPRTPTTILGGARHLSSTTYYATFQVESGDRMELRLSGAEYGMLAEGDRGRLTFQGTRYLSFERE